MEIFNKHIFGEDAEFWLKQCKEWKKDWILKYTNQTDLTIIDEFINNPKISKECKCLDCGNKRKRISKEITTVAKSIDDTGNSTENSTERPKKTKGTKNK